MRNPARFLYAHLQESKLLYWQHALCAFWMAFLHLMVVPVAILHGFFPFILGGLGKRLHKRIWARYWAHVHFWQDCNGEERSDSGL